MPHLSRVIDINTTFGVQPAIEVDWSPDKLVSMLARNDVDCALTCSLRGAHYDFISGNQETWETCQRHERLLPVATIDPRRHFGYREEIATRVEQGFRAFRFFTEGRHGWSLDSLAFLNIVEMLAAHPVVVMLPVGLPGQATTTAQALEPFELPVVMLGTGYSLAGEMIAVMRRFENVYCDLHLVDSPGMIEGMAGEAGADRLLFGSNAPQRYVESSLNMITYSSLSPDEKAAVLGGNAARLLGLEVA